MPGLLKGWIDRVFANGWAYDYSPDTGVTKKLRHLKVHLVAIGGADLRTYARHGYFGAMKTQIDHGIFDYCGARVMTSELLLDSETPDMTPHLDTAHEIGLSLFAKSQRCDNGRASRWPARSFLRAVRTLQRAAASRCGRRASGSPAACARRATRSRRCGMR